MPSCLTSIFDLNGFEEIVKLEVKSANQNSMVSKRSESRNLSGKQTLKVRQHNAYSPCELREVEDPWY